MFYAFIKLPEGKVGTERNVVFMDDLLEEAKTHAAAVVKELRSDLTKMKSVQFQKQLVFQQFVSICKFVPTKFPFRWDDAFHLRESAI